MAHKFNLFVVSSLFAMAPITQQYQELGHLSIAVILKTTYSVLQFIYFDSGLQIQSPSLIQWIICWAASKLDFQTSALCGERGAAPARHFALAVAWHEGRLHKSSPCRPGSPRTDAHWVSCSAVRHHRAVQWILTLCWPGVKTRVSV